MSWLSFRRRFTNASPDRTCRRLAIDVLEDRLAPATLIVNTLDDGVTANDGKVTLREAIAAAQSPGTTTDSNHTSTGDDVIQFSPGLSGTILLTEVGGTTLGRAAFGIGANKVVVIDGAEGGGSIILDLRNATPMRFFNVASSGSLSLTGLTLTRGKAVGGHGAQGGGGGAGMGGAIYNQGSLSIASCSLLSNAASGGNGANYTSGSSAGGGGGMFGRGGSGSFVSATDIRGGGGGGTFSDAAEPTSPALISSTSPTTCWMAISLRAIFPFARPCCSRTNMWGPIPSPSSPGSGRSTSPRVN